MLGQPENGWVLFQLGSEETAYDLSYLTDVPVEWLNQAIYGLRTLAPFTVRGYCEPGHMLCTVSVWSCYVIFEEETAAPACHDVRQIHVNMLEFCKMLHRDISEHLDDWVHWDEDKTEDELSQRETELKDRLRQLEALIEKQKDDFELEDE